MDKTIDIIVVEHKDRLARFETNYIEKLLSLDNRKIEVINPLYRYSFPLAIQR